MTAEEITKRISELEDRRAKLVDQLTDVDTHSATLSAGGGSKSYTNRSIADIKAKIKFVDREISRLNARLSGGGGSGSIKTIYAEFS